MDIYMYKEMLTEEEMEVLRNFRLKKKEEEENKEKRKKAYEDFSEAIRKFTNVGGTIIIDGSGLYYELTDWFFNEDDKIITLYISDGVWVKTED